jgi:hypothetical protein
MQALIADKYEWSSTMAMTASEQGRGKASAQAPAAPDAANAPLVASMY